jgi:hypothetical protein
MRFYYNRWSCPVLETESDRRQRQSAKGENQGRMNYKDTELSRLSLKLTC